MTTTGSPVAADPLDTTGTATGRNHTRHHGRVAVAVVARHPGPMRGKTRLAAGVGVDEAARAYRVLLDDTMRRIGDVAGVRPVVAWGEPPRHPAEDATPAGFATLVQRGDGLGERLANILADLFAGGAPAVVLVGADSPALPRRFVIDAVARLRRGDADVVLGPAADGGFYLLGCTRDAWGAAGQTLTALLRTMPAGTPLAFEHVKAGAVAGGLQTAVLPLWVDVDLADDLRVAARLLPALSPPSATGSAGPAGGITTARGPQDADGSQRPRLQEVYLHLTDRCEAACPHCYAADNTQEDRGLELSTERWLEVADQAMALGATSFVLIGGDPFLRPDLLDLVEALAGRRQVRVRLFFSRALGERQVHDLAAAGHGRLTPLLSVDGTAAHEMLRGPGTLAPALATARTLVDVGLDPVVNTVLLRPVLPDLPDLVVALSQAGVRRLHLILPHRRGGLGRLPGLVPSGAELLQAVDTATSAACGSGLAIDNHAAWGGRLRAPRDLCSAGCSLLAIDPYGRVSACPITCGDDAFVAGDLESEDLESILRRSPTLALLRHAHARDRVECRDCPVVDACGGECWVQAHYAAVAEGRPAGYRAPFPYCDLVRPLLERMAAAGHGRTSGSQCGSCVPVGDPRGAVGADLGGRPPDYTPFDCI